MRRPKHSWRSEFDAESRLLREYGDAEIERLQDLSARSERGEEIPEHELRRSSIPRSRRPRSRSIPLPTYPFAAYLFRMCPSFADALKEWRVQQPRLSQRVEAANKIIESLGAGDRPDYINAWRVGLELVRRSRSAKSIVAAELRGDILPLLWAYKDLDLFFREIAPHWWPRDFSIEENTLLNLQSRTAVVGRALHSWGADALRNPGIRVAFLSLSPAEAVDVSSYADSKQFYRPDGRRLGSRDRQGRPRRQRHTKNEMKMLEQAADGSLPATYHIDLVKQLRERGHDVDVKRLRDFAAREVRRLQG